MQISGHQNDAASDCEWRTCPVAFVRRIPGQAHRATPVTCSRHSSESFTISLMTDQTEHVAPVINIPQVAGLF